MKGVRGFLGLAGTVRIWIKGFAELAKPLVILTTKEATFRWELVQQSAMDTLKEAIATCPAIRPIDYKCGRLVILSVDTSHIACGYLLQQDGEDSRRRIARFGSIAWSDVELCYSQAKLELRGLWRALHAMRMYLVGLQHFAVEMDAKYVRGMLNNPDVHPNASVNRWIAAILMFNFDIIHVPADRFKGPDGLSRREATEDPGDIADEDAENWVDDEVLGATVWVASFLQSEAVGNAVVGMVTAGNSPVASSFTAAESATKDGPPQTDDTKRRDQHLDEVKYYLTHLKVPSSITTDGIHALQQRARPYFVTNRQLFRRDRHSRHQLVIPYAGRILVLRMAHDELGHRRGFYPVRRRIADRFWWPNMDADIAWYLKTCHQCQVESTEKVHLPPVVSYPAGLFQKCHIDTMHLPKANGFQYIITGRCSLTNWPEFRMLRSETGETVGQFVFEEILCRWGGLSEIFVTDNGPPIIAAVDYLSKKYGIRHIRISAYNSQANGLVEVGHRPIRDALKKLCKSKEKDWPKKAHLAFWAERITTLRRTRMSPFYATHGVEPLLSFDLLYATFLFPEFHGKLLDTDLLYMRARQLERRDEDIAHLEKRVIASRFRSIGDFERRYANTIHDYNFKPGALVLVLNKKIEEGTNRKFRPRYFGPMVVVRRSQGGAYYLAELNGAISRLKFAAFRLIPYYARSSKEFIVTEFVDPADLAGIVDDEQDNNVRVGDKE